MAIESTQETMAISPQVAAIANEPFPLGISSDKNTPVRCYFFAVYVVPFRLAKCFEELGNGRSSMATNTSSCIPFCMKGNSSLEDNEDRGKDALQFVRQQLHRSLWVQVDDTRWIYGNFICLDHLKNLILENSFEVTCEGIPLVNNFEKRQRLDCCIIPGEKVRRILMEESP